jgi:hypothetical protein
MATFVVQSMIDFQFAGADTLQVFSSYEGNRNTPLGDRRFREPQSVGNRRLGFVDLQNITGSHAGES